MNQSYTMPIRTPTDIVTSGLEWSMNDADGYDQNLMRESEDPVFQTLWREKTTAPFSGGNPDVSPINKITQSNHGFYCDHIFKVATSR